MACSLVLLAIVPTASAQPPETTLGNLLRERVYPLTVAEGRLDGPGADFLEGAAEGALFVALGENHNTRAVPDLAVGLFRLLHGAHGFEHLALEEGPALGDLLSEAVRGGAPDGAFRLGLLYPGSFHLYTEEELRMIDRVGALSGADRPIWGLNQEFGLAHVLDRLAALAPSARARTVAEGLLQRVAPYEGERFARDTSFLAAVATPADFQALREAFRPSPGSEADRLLAQVELSHAVWAPYQATPRPGLASFFESGRMREENMKRLFAEQYWAAADEAHTRGGGPPRVLVKSGHVHLGRGLGRFNETYTLGNFLSEVATFLGGRSLHVYVVLNWDDLPESFFAPLLSLLPPEADAVLDLRPAHAWAAHGALGDLDPELRRVLVGYDVLVVLADTSLGSVEALRTPAFRWYPRQ